jgi:hypothetical protein
MNAQDVLKCTRIITHANCPDGIIAAAIVHHYIPDAMIEPVHYGTPERENLHITPGMIFVDMTPPDALVEEAVAAGAIVLDHHNGAKDKVLAFGENGVFADEVTEPGISGAVLAYRHVALPLGEFAGVFNNTGILLIGIRDTWQKNSPLWKDACAFSAAVLFNGQEYYKTHHCLADTESLGLGYKLLAVRQVEVDRCIANIVTFDRFDGLTFGIYMDPAHLSSDVGEKAIEEIGLCDVTAGFSYRKSNDGILSLNFSLRSNGKYDVSRLASRHGGSGHTRAAGFSVPVDPFLHINPYSLFNFIITHDQHEDDWTGTFAYLG